MIGLLLGDCVSDWICVCWFGSIHSKNRDLKPALGGFGTKKPEIRACCKKNLRKAGIFLAGASASPGECRRFFCKCLIFKGFLRFPRVHPGGRVGGEIAPEKLVLRTSEMIFWGKCVFQGEKMGKMGGWEKKEEVNGQRSTGREIGESRAFPNCSSSTFGR